jgi:hypothetical protein
LSAVAISPCDPSGKSLRAKSLAQMRDPPALPRRPPINRRQNHLRQKTHFASQFKQITPVQPFCEKYFSFVFSEIMDT